jgi:uncharacterized RDD family membrane protein YckC
VVEDLAGIGRRAAAHVVDEAIVLLSFGAGVLLGVAPARRIAGQGAQEGDVVIASVVQVGIAIVAGILASLWLCWLEGRTGRSPGRRAMGIRLVDAATGTPIGFARALGRTLFAGFVSYQLAGLGYLWAIWDDHNQTWHDKVVSAVVVHG